MKELRQVYSAPTEEAALIALDRLEENWANKYSLSIRPGDRIGLTLPHFSSIRMK